MTDLLRHTAREDGRESVVTVELAPERRADRQVPAALYGKFVEHLYSTRRSRNALEAQLLRNPTLGSWKFRGRYDADGGRGGTRDPETIADRVEAYAASHGLPDADRLRSAYREGTALWWVRCGGGRVRTSPEVGTAGDRAQRVEVRGEGEDRARGGIGQWCRLPLERTRGFEARLTVRAADPTDVRVALHGGPGFDAPVDARTVRATADYRTVEVGLSGEGIDRDGVAGLSLTAEAPANVVVDRLLLYPDDHVGGADPEVISLLREANLPLLRWPGGNFASGYHWRDGVGPVEERPTRPNPAWDGLEPNLFGTDEFLAFCERVGCEPMLCVNAGDGTPAEAARWVEYCNGSRDTEMGALRAENGHREPYGVTYWEVGNELYGEWQRGWTTPRGHADRFERFREAIRAVDPGVELLACGNRLTDWNDALFDRTTAFDWLTDHVLVECHADAGTDPVELFNAHTGFAAQLGAEHRAMAAEWAAARAGDGDGDRNGGADDPSIAVTELQLFTRYDEGDVEGERRMEPDELPGSDSIAEAIFDAAVRNRSLRDGVVGMVTHSGVGNHGGGIDKRGGRAWAEPCLHGLGMETALVGGRPVGVDVACPTFSTETAFGTDTAEWFGELRPVDGAPSVDAVAATDAAGGDVVLVLVHCDAGSGAFEVTVDGGGLFENGTATVTTLTADRMHEGNSREAPERVAPVEERVAVEDGRLGVTLPQYGIVRVIVDR